MTLKQEIKYAEDNNKRFIPPYKLNEIMRLSGKIIKLLTENTTAVTLSYTDMETVMQIVGNALEQGRQE